MDLLKLSLGEQFLPIVGKGEGAYAGYDGIFYLTYNFSHPKNSEIEQMKSDKPFELRFAEIDNVIFLLSKAGTLNWTDAPFTPHWEDPKPFILDLPVDNQGYTLLLIMTDAYSSAVKSLRYMSLSNKFSIALRDKIIDNYKKPFAGIDNYQGKINKLYSRYTTDDILKLSSAANRFRA